MKHLVVEEIISEIENGNYIIEQELSEHNLSYYFSIKDKKGDYILSFNRDFMQDLKEDRNVYPDFVTFHYTEWSRIGQSPQEQCVDHLGYQKHDFQSLADEHKMIDYLSKHKDCQIDFAEEARRLELY